MNFLKTFFLCVNFCITVQHIAVFVLCLVTKSQYYLDIDLYYWEHMNLT